MRRGLVVPVHDRPEVGDVGRRAGFGRRDGVGGIGDVDADARTARRADFRPAGDGSRAGEKGATRERNHD